VTAIDVRDRARSVADLPNSQLITADDELNSINETYHDVYDWLLQNDDDYFVTETTLTVTASMLSSSNLSGSEYVVPLPADFYRLRYLDYNSNSQWMPINKGALSARDINPAEPTYRIRGAYLWLTGGLTNYTIRIGYYPVPSNISLPLAPISFGTSYTPASFSNITCPYYIGLGQTMFYVYGGTAVVCESVSTNTVGSPVTIYNTAATVAQMQWYKGYLYWQSGTANIFRGATIGATITATTAVTSTGDVTDFSIYKDTIYYTTTLAVKSCTLVGGSIASLGPVTGPICPTFIGASVYYVDSSGILRLLGSTATIMSAVRSIQSDGVVLFINDTSNNLYYATVTTITLGTLATLSTDVLSCHIPEVQITTPQSALDQTYLPVITRETQQLLALGSAAPFNFTYPNNLFTEVMSYQMAIDFKSKAKQDPSLLVGRLGDRDVGTGCSGLWLRFYQSIKRDDYQPGRINNRYSRPWGLW
jgi:hypothetical protein